MSATQADAAVPLRRLIAEALREEGATWLFVARAALALYVTGWLAMRLALPQPSTAMMTTVIVMNRQAGMVLAKSFYRAVGTLAGAAAALAIMALFPQERVLFLLALSLWIGLCAGGATLHRNFKAYGFVLSGYTAAIVAVPVVAQAPLAVFDSAVARISEVLLGILVAGVVCDTVFPSRMRESLWRLAREQFAHFIAFVRDSAGDTIRRDAMEKAHLRFVREAVGLEDLRSSVIFEDADARARNGQLQWFNQRFMEASTSFQSLYHLVSRLRRAGHARAVEALSTLYRPVGEALDVPAGTGELARPLLPRLAACRAHMAAEVPRLRAGLADEEESIDFDTGVELLRRFLRELHAYVEAAAALRAPRVLGGSAEKARFERGNDYVGAALTMVHTALTMLALGLFWVYSDWPSGAGATVMAAAFCGLFASVPNPVRVTGQVLLGYALGMSAGFVCEFFVLTRMDGYGLLVAGTLPFFLIGPYLMNMTPARANVGIGYSMSFVYILALNNQMQFDPTRFINDAISQLVSLGTVVVAFLVVPPASGHRWFHRRQVEQLRRQVALAAEAPLPGLSYRFESINRDLFHQVVARTAQGSTDSRLLLAWALAVNETGRALIELRQAVAAHPLPAAVRAATDAAMERLALFYERPDSGRYLAARDATEAAVAAVRAARPAADRLLGHLHLLRMALLDGESVIAEYMPDPSDLPTSSPENRHAP
jgi:uncharacterized membrane protein YccC